jgi:PTH1 family peptidyl-tRNA hydrolase
VKLIVGLGNPGFWYSRNRHNIGFMCVRHLARKQRIRFDKKQGHARTGIGNIGRHRVVLARPQTYMNASGESVSALMRKLNLIPTDIVVIHDDLDLPTGKIRLRLGGGSGGHKGIDSIIARIGAQDFYRVRVGVGRPDTTATDDAGKEEAIISYVLSNFTREERMIIDKTVPEVSRAVVCLLTEGIDAAMNKFN